MRKTTYCRIPESSRKGKGIKTENQSVVSRVWEWGGQGWCIKMYKEIFKVMEIFYIMIVVVVT